MASTYSQIHRFGTQAQYDALKEANNLNSNYLYFTSDTNKLYKGTLDYTNDLISVSAVPQAGVAGKIYFETTTNQVKAYVNGAWTVISYPLTQSIDSANASSYKVASEAAIVSFVEGQIGGDGVLSDLAQKMDSSSVAVPGSLTATKGNGTTFDIALQGVTVSPTWDDSTRVLTLPVVGANGQTSNVTVNIGKDIFLESGHYDSDTKEIVLVLNDEAQTEIRVPASALYNDYQGGSTNSGTVAIDATSHVITFNLNVNASTANALKLDSNGLMVDLGAYATTAAVDDIRASLQGQIDSTTATLAATTASLGTLENNYNATTAALETLTTNYNATTAALDTLTSNYDATTASLDTLTSNYNATTVQVATNTEDIAALATAATSWAPFAEEE